MLMMMVMVMIVMVWGVSNKTPQQDVAKTKASKIQTAAAGRPAGRRNVS